MLQDRATSEENVVRFIERTVRERNVWGLISKSGEWAFCPSHEMKNTDVLVFWSDRAYAARHVREGWSEYVPKSIALDQFLCHYLKVMHEDGFLLRPTSRFLELLPEFGDHGIVLFQMSRPVSDTLCLDRVPEDAVDRVLVQNGLHLAFYLPHAGEVAQFRSPHLEVIERLLEVPEVTDLVSKTRA